MKIPFIALTFLAAAAPVGAADWEVSGDVRAGLLGSETRTRAGVTSDTSSGRARVRAGVRTQVSGDWSFHGRAAARLDTRQDALSFALDWAAPGDGALRDGDATLDTLHFEYAPAGGAWRARVGRFQTGFALAGVAAKSLDRLDSPSFDVSWTDGVWLERRGDAWSTHVILQHNDAAGPSNALRPPLAFGGDAARVGAFIGIAANAPAGPVVQRVLGLTVLPGALRPSGIAHVARDDYFALTVKAAAEWPTPRAGTRLLLAGEVGYAPNTPDRTLVGSGDGDAGGLAWQASVNLLNVFPAHSVGIVYARVADGWLLSPHFRPNAWLLEARWLWRAHPRLALDARVRRRSEIDLPFATLHPRRTEDFHVRATWRF